MSTPEVMKVGFIGLRRAFTMTSTGMTSLVLAALAAAILGGCASHWTTTWTPEKICEVAHGGQYSSDGNCYYPSPSS